MDGIHESVELGLLDVRVDLRPYPHLALETTLLQSAGESDAVADRGDPVEQTQDLLADGRPC